MKEWIKIFGVISVLGPALIPQNASLDYAPKDIFVSILVLFNFFFLMLSHYGYYVRVYMYVEYICAFAILCKPAQQLLASCLFSSEVSILFHNFAISQVGFGT